MFQGTFELLAKQRSNDTIKTMPVHLNNRGTQREYSSKPQSIVKRILVFKR